MYQNKTNKLQCSYTLYTQFHRVYHDSTKLFQGAYFTVFTCRLPSNPEIQLAIFSPYNMVASGNPEKKFETAILQKLYILKFGATWLK